MIYAPFNFVPLSEKVYFPKWASQISHDIPFSDGRSGMIKIKMKSVTPIFIRNGHTPDDKENWTDNYMDFCHTPDGRYFIPATSVKGMVRNILEIVSFGKMSRVTNKRYSIRDLYMPAYTGYFRNHEIHCGWMVIDEQHEKVTITDHDVPGRISADEIDSRLHIGLSDFVYEKDRGNLTLTKNRYAKAKYDLLKRKENVSLDGLFREIPNENVNKVDNRMIVQYSNTGKKGTIVFTGQPGRRKPKDKVRNKKATGKYYEFVFFDNVLNTYTIPIRQEGGLFDDFCFIYKDSEDWKYWRRQERIPVFFTLDDNNEIEYMGLSYMFRLPTKKHIKEFLDKKHLQDTFDLAECIFGTTSDTSLKGRVQFSHAFCNSVNPHVCDVVRPYMGSPKPSYYPIYTRQIGSDGKIKGNFYKTFLDDDAKLRGWKRYPVRRFVSEVAQAADGQEKNTSPFRPLSENTEFECVVRYHNLREVELGALLYALTPFDNCLFSLGFCKPYGYGVIKLEVTNMPEEEVWLLKQKFIEEMNTVEDKYEQSPQIKELRGMMMISGDNPSYPLRYMKDPKVFSSEKKDKQYLQDYSKIRVQTQEEKDAEKKRLEKENEMKEAQKKAEEEAAEQARIAEELAEEKRRAEAKQAEIDQKLSSGLDGILNEKYSLGPNEGKYKVNSFKVCKTKCSQWLKLNNTDKFTDEETIVLASVLTRLKNNPDKSEKKLWKNKESFLWKDIRQWLGDDWQGEPFE